MYTGNVVCLYVLLYLVIAGCGTVALELNFCCLEKIQNINRSQQHTEVIGFNKRKVREKKPLRHQLECFRFQKLIK